MNSAAAQIPACLATTVCPNCGYSLAGLADSGVCPECAREYDQSQVILYGWGRGQHESVATAKKTRVAWVLIMSTFCLFAQFFFSAQFWLFGAHAVRNGLIVMAAIGAVVAYGLFRRSETTHPGQVQIRLTDAGAVQYDSLQGPGDLQHLLATRGFWLPLICAAALLACYLRGWIGAMNFWIYFIPAIVIGVIAWVYSLQIRRELAKIREGSIADANAAYQKPTPWAKLSPDFLLHPTKDGNYRLRMETVTLWLTHYPIDAEIQCTAEQAAALGKYIRSKIPDPAEAIRQQKQDQMMELE